MNKVCLMGAPLNTTNMGVSALAISFIRIIREIDKEMDVSLLAGTTESGFQRIDIGDSEYDVKIINYRMSPKSRLEEHLLWMLFLSFLHRICPAKSLRNKIIGRNRLLKEIDESLFVGSIHGGDSFSDIYGLGRFFSAVIPDVIAIFLRKRLVLLPQTYGPFKNRFVEKIACSIINKASVVLCRDENGPDGVKEMFNKNMSLPKIQFCPDVAFFLHSKWDSKKSTENTDAQLRPPIIGININGLMYNGGYNRKNMFGLKIDYGRLITSIIQHFILNSDAIITLIPHNNASRGKVESDLHACEDVLKNILETTRHRIHIVEQKRTPYEIKGVISRCDFFIGSRMHACIAALSSGVPAIGIAYSKKFIGVFESIGVADLVLDARTVDKETAIDIVWQHYNNKDFWSVLLKSRVPELHKLIISTFKEIKNDALETYPLYCEELQRNVKV